MRRWKSPWENRSRRMMEARFMGRASWILWKQCIRDLDLVLQRGRSCLGEAIGWHFKMP